MRNYFTDYLSVSISKIDKALFEVLTRWEKEMHKANPVLAPLAQEFVKSCKGGKRLRGALVRLGYELAGGEVNNEIFKIAAAYEVFHTAILVHDDIIDRSDFRRGKPALHKALGNDHHGISQAISLGDAGFFLALKTIANSLFPDDKKNKALQIFIDNMLDTATGEMLDVGLPKEKDGVKEDDVLVIAKLKTARYSFAGPLMVGAVLGGADKSLLSGIEKFGENIGIAYQIQDDILGVFGDEKSTGKSTTSDITEGKATFLIAYAFGQPDKKQKNILKQCYGKKEATKVDIENIRNIFIKIGALKYAQEKVSYYLKKANTELSTVAIKNPAIRLLGEFPDYLMGRKL